MSARTLRQIVGLAPGLQARATLPAAKTALVLIDYQHEYCSGPLALPDEARVTPIACRLRAWAEQSGIAVIHVLHRAPAGSLLFAEGSPGAEPLAGLVPAAGETVIYKQLPSAFTGTGLAEALQAKGSENLLIAGYMTHNCVDSTAREAFHRGYKVGIVADASATRDLPGPGGETIPAAQVHAGVLAGLGDRIAEIIDLATLQALRVV
ncbi:cysteine hydrolase family protein [Dechloromonas denitrificans]|uniref:cysteine hydrolase family protein n=1 Tax=Dechloromonas denitrificans TaxID=281362 RepID=UPI001CF959E8|nr:cysteine hydrolase family protein [Dechloromonas denitrificans]UCV06307.1 cysteine hydrolase [Dechloromonas denitrificans]